MNIYIRVFVSTTENGTLMLCFKKNDFEIKILKNWKVKSCGEWVGGRGTMISEETIDKLIILKTRTSFVISRSRKTESLQELKIKFK